WLGLSAEGPLEVSHAAIDAPLLAVLAATEEWAGWEEVRAAAAAGFSAEDDGPDPDDVDDYLLVLVDQGLLEHDLRPPLVGPPPLDWTRARLARVPTEAAAQALAQLEPAEAALVHTGQAVLSRALAERDLAPALAERLAALAELLGAGPFDVAGLALGAYGDSLSTVDEDPTTTVP